MNTEAPELLALKLQLSLMTQVDAYELADWIRANRDWLNHHLLCDMASNIGHPDYRDELSAVLRIEFKRRTSVKLPKATQQDFRPVAVAPGLSSTTAHHSSRTGIFARLLHGRPS